MVQRTRKGNKPAKVLIVDDHPAVREALAIRISRQPDLKVCGEAADLADALRLFTETEPDVAVIDIGLRTGNGLDLIKRIKSRNESARMLVWSMHSESLYAERALHAGALGYITKEHATDKIIDAIRHVLAGKIYLSEQLAERLLLSAVTRRKSLDSSPIEKLSDRELEAFELFGQGLSTKEVARKLQVSPKTIETYRLRIKDKLQLSAANEVVQRAAQWVVEQRK
jgi:DNA-binding NarL/FixJ family response regulator